MIVNDDITGCHQDVTNSQKVQFQQIPGHTEETMKTPPGLPVSGNEQTPGMLTTKL
jgi:hypothetical protein